jgi:hypothetical protein
MPLIASSWTIPRLHMCLHMLLRLWIVVLKAFQARTSHQEESDVLDVFDIRLVGDLSLLEHNVDSGGSAVLTPKIFRISVLPTTGHKDDVRRR